MDSLPFLLFFLLFFCSSCEKDSIVTQTPKNYNDALNLSHIQWGQTSRYIAYKADCEDVEGSFSFTGDTLVVEVIEEREALFITEHLTPFSTSYLNGEVTETFKYPVEIQQGRIVLKERGESRLFYFYDSDYLPLNFPHLMPTAHQAYCRLNLGTAPFTGNELVQFPKFEFGPIQLYNKAAVSCRPVIEGEGYLMYDKNQLYLSHAIHFDATGILGDDPWIDGWLLLED